jgi:hypothetical protein
MGRVFQDQVGEVDGGRCRVDRPGITGPGQKRKPASVIEMCVGQNDRIQPLECPFLRNAVVIFDLAGALKESEVHEDIGFPSLQ